MTTDTKIETLIAEAWARPKSTEPRSSAPVIPSLNEVRADYIRDHTRNFDSYTVGRTLTSEQEFYADKFDRWLTQHDAEVRAQALRGAADGIANMVPYGMELLPDGREDKQAAAYVEGVHTAYDALRAEADRIEQEATDV